MEGSEAEKQVELPSSVDKLPPLKEGYVRLVHITNSRNIDGIKENGLDYEKQGMISSTASAYTKQEDVEYSSTDPRFSQPGLKTVVMDIPIDDYRLHNDVTKSPGAIPPNYIVGIVDPK